MIFKLEQAGFWYLGLKLLSLALGKLTLSFCWNKYSIGKALRLVLGKFMYLAVRPDVQ